MASFYRYLFQVSMHSVFIWCMVDVQIMEPFSISLKQQQLIHSNKFTLDLQIYLSTLK